MTPPPAERPLEGRRILLTRSEARAGSLIERLRSRGAEVEARAAIDFEPPSDAGPAEAAVSRLQAYDWLVFTSPTGVRYFDELLARRDRGRPNRARVVAIGPGTARALAAAGYEAGVVASESHGEGLKETLRSRLRGSDRVLVIRPEVAPEGWVRELRDQGANVESPGFYRTVASPVAARIAESLSRGAYDGIILTSPSNLKFLLLAAGEKREPIDRGLASIRRVAIGPTTAAAMHEAGFPPDAVATSPDDESIVEAVVVAFSS